MSYELHSAFQFEVRRAALAWAQGELKGYAERFASTSLLPHRPADGDKLNVALNDERTMALEGGWRHEKVIPAVTLSRSARQAPGEAAKYSTVELQAKSSRETVEVVVRVEPREPWTNRYRDTPRFYQFLTAALVQINLDVAVHFIEDPAVFIEDPAVEPGRRQRLIVASGSAPAVPPGLGHFRPLLFVAYHDDSVTLKDPATPR